MITNPYKSAGKKVKARKDFYIHLAVFFIINIFLFAVNMLTSPWYFWFLFPLMAWGVAIAIHYVVTFGIPGVGSLDEKWEAEEIEKELRRMRQHAKDFEPEKEDELQLKEVRKARKDWDDSDLV